MNDARIDIGLAGRNNAGSGRIQPTRAVRVIGAVRMRRRFTVDVFNRALGDAMRPFARGGLAAAARPNFLMETYVSDLHPVIA